MVLPVLQRVNPGDIEIAHHWTGDRVKLHSFQHRHYWHKRGRRERNSMIAVMRLVASTDTVYDVGAHIGYLTLLFARLAAEVYAFEPTTETLPYLRHNVRSKPNVEIVESAAGAAAGSAEMFVETLTGQNNTLADSFQFERTVAQAGRVAVHTGHQTVPVVTLDDFAAEHSPPDFVKIDVEGYEWEVLQGAGALLHDRPPALLIEMTRKQQETRELLTGLGYEILPDTLGYPGETPATLNHICLHAKRHKELIERLVIK